MNDSEKNQQQWNKEEHWGKIKNVEKAVITKHAAKGKFFFLVMIILFIMYMLIFKDP